MRRPLLLGVVMLWGFLLLCEAVSALSQSKPIVVYKIQVQLIPEEKAVRGREVLSWLNDSQVPVSELQFHLYLNAFKNNRSTFMRESGGSHRGFRASDKTWGFIDVNRIQVVGGVDLTAVMEYIQPDDNNTDDRTVMRLLLPEAVPPQGKITLEIDFYAKLPKVFARSGYGGDFYMVAQWFPKIGVFQGEKWNCHQYHQESEFFADYGVYEVEITVPAEFVVGATGPRIQEIENGDGTKTYTHYQEDVHDFAWTACPDFVEFREAYSLSDPVVKTEMILLVHRSHLNLKERYLSSLRNGLEFYSQNYGAYPYTTVTLVDPPINATGAGGMEYPTLFTSMGVSFIPQGVLMPEMVTIHEFGHGYWYGIIGTNEFEEAWLDEGINTYSEMKAMAQYYGEDQSLINLGPLKISDLVLQRSRVIASAALDPILKNSWEFYSPASYSSSVYSKAGLVLITLENYLGEEIMARIMKTFYERWKFKHPRSEDFFTVASEVSGQDLQWFFDQFFRSQGQLDYAIRTARSIEINPPEGVFPERAAWEQNLPAPEILSPGTQERLYKTEVTVERKGEWVFPQNVLLIFANGEEVWEHWDGKARWKRFVYQKPFRLKSAHIDPDRRIVLDVNYLNNSYAIKSNKNTPRKWALSLMLKLQQLFSFVSL